MGPGGEFAEDTALGERNSGDDPMTDLLFVGGMVALFIATIVFIPLLRRS